MLPAPFKLERYFAQYEFNVRYLLCASDCESLAIEELLALEPGAAQRFGRQRLGYTETLGAPSLRAEIAAVYSGVTPDEVLVHAGAEEAIYLFMRAALAPGDHLVVHRPCYQSHFEIAHSLGCAVSGWWGREEQGWALDVDELQALLRPNTRAIVISSPHNPTGYQMAGATFRAIARLADQRGIWLLSDEVYRECEYKPQERLPAAADLGERCVTLGAVSKTYGLPGLRIGWLATHDRGLLAKVAALKDYTSICAAAPSEFLAEVALRRRQALIARSLATISANLALLDDFFARRAGQVRWVRPAAGPVGFAQWLGGDVEAFCERLVRQAGVLLLPGSVFDDAGEHFRLGFGRQNLPEALARLEEFLDSEG